MLIIAGAAVIFVLGLMASQSIGPTSPRAMPGLALTISGPIIDAKTGALVNADVYVHDNLVQEM